MGEGLKRAFAAVDLNNEIARLRAALAAANEAIGLATTIKGDMEIRTDDPIGMMREVVAHAMQAEADRDALLDAAHGLCCGYDWNRGTHAITHGYRLALLEAVHRLRLVMDFDDKRAAICRPSPAPQAEMPEATIRADDRQRLAYCFVDQGERTIGMDYTAMNLSDAQRLYAWLPSAIAWMRAAREASP